MYMLSTINGARPLSNAKRELLLNSGSFQKAWFSASFALFRREIFVKICIIVIKNEIKLLFKAIQRA